MADPRHTFIVSTIRDVLGSEGRADWENDKAIDRFLNETEVTMLVGCKAVDEKTGSPVITVANAVDGSNRAQEVVIVKRVFGAIPDKDIQSSVMISSLAGNAFANLHLAFENLYGPKLLGSGASNLLEPKEQEAFVAFRAALKRVVVKRGADSAADAKGPVDEKDTSSILTFSDEWMFWKEHSQGNGAAVERALAISRSFEPLTSSFQNLGKSDSVDPFKLIDEVADVLNNVFLDHKFPQIRMEHLLAVIASHIGTYIKAKMPANVWRDNFSSVRESIAHWSRLADHFSETRRDLTDVQWKHRWGVRESLKNENDSLAFLRKRLDEIRNIRGVYEELMRLLPPEDQRRFKLNQVLDGLANADALQTGPFAEPKWQALVADFDRQLVPIEYHAAQQLKSRISALSDRPHLLVGEFRSFRSLFTRKNVIRELQAELESLLTQLQAHIDNLKVQFDRESSSYGANSGAPAGRNFSVLVNGILWANQLQDKVKQTEDTVNSVLSSVRNVERFQAAANDLLSRLKEYSKGLFDEWQQGTLSSLNANDHELTLEMKGKLMDLDLSRDGELKVYYGEKLVVLLREARQLSEMGYKVDKKISDAVTTGERFYRYGLKLKQVANFYNTMSEQIINSQKPMLVQEAKNFEKVIYDSKSATWNNPDEVERYMGRLTKAAEALTSRNRKLRRIHLGLADAVVHLMSADLLNKSEEWYEQVRKLDTVFLREGQFSEPRDMIAWKAHWDQQLYKALEVQYKYGMATLNDTIPDIPADVIFSRKQLGFRPPLEDLRLKYYKGLKKFLDVPKTFKGFSEHSSVFEKIPERNAAGLLLVYENAEILFDQLAALIKKYEHWIVVGLVDIDDLCEKRLVEVEDWDANYKALKGRRKLAERIPDSEKIGPFKISLTPLKNSVDDLISRWSDALTLSLHKSAKLNYKEMDTWLATSMEKLATAPQTVEEMGAAMAAWKVISDAKPTYQKLFTRLNKKTTLLRTKVVNINLDVAGLQPRWQQLLVALEAFNDLLDEQRDKIKGDIEKRIRDASIEIDKFASKWKALKPAVDKDVTADVAQRIMSELDAWFEELSGVEKTVETVTRDAEHFEIQVPPFTNLDDVKNDIGSVKQMWALYGDFSKGLETMTKEPWVAFRANLNNFDDFLSSWMKKLKTRGVYDPIYEFLSNEVKKMKELWPILRKCTGELFETEHWKLLFNYLSFPSDVNLGNLTLQHFLNAHDKLLASDKQITYLQSRAQGEVSIREAVQELKVWADTAVFSLLDHVAAKNRQCKLIKNWKDLFTKLSDQQAMMSSLRESPYFGPFEDQAKQFESKLLILDECCHNISNIQRKWLYLEPIFGRGALPSEQGRFARINSTFLEIMDSVGANPQIFHLASFPNLIEVTTQLLDQLERCQKALNDFLEEKRNKFARFYFIGDDDLLEILGQATNPVVIQSHLKKLFQGINSVGFNDDNTKIVSMKSGAGEVVPLLQPLPISENVEEWLQKLALAMEAALAQQLLDCLKLGDYNKYPSQIINLAEHVNFTQRVEAAISNSTLKNLLKELDGTLSELTSLDVSDTPLLQIKLKSLIMDLIHNIDVVKQLDKFGVTVVADWLWQKQLRCYIGPDNLAKMRMVDAEFKYSYEYQGNAARLVHTPLTDKCYLVLTQGMNLGYGGNSYGPAGTGKTESVKALGLAFGRQVLVFNCDEGIDFQSMGRIFTGLVKSGAWGCFDEFNRLKEDQLSAVSQQIQVIQSALKRHDKFCELLGRQVNVNLNAAIFVTMNPASKEYGGRSKLPHNLKQLFRAVAMSAPDFELICEVELYAEGFRHAADIGRKVTQIYTLSRQLLSPQRHYDWGLRALKTVLSHSGKLIKEAKKSGQAIDFNVEAKLIIGALRINTLSKLTFTDAVRFNALVSDLFPGVVVEEVNYDTLVAAIKQSLAEMHLEVNDNQIHKILQTNASLNQRMGLTLVGPSGCGKSVILAVLHRALTRLGKKVVKHVMNPKALERSKLLGNMDNDTREWTDGVLTAASRQVMKEPMEVQSWVICDGDVDPEWIESLNSVLDDNHLLTMPNGERIKFYENVNFIFETHDLQFASPATVSRCGMIFMSDEDVDVKSAVTAWVTKQARSMPEDKQQAWKERITQWLDELFYKALEWTMAHELVIETTRMGLATTCLSHLVGVDAHGEFVVALIRGMGCNMDLPQRTAFAKEVFQWSGERPPDLQQPLDCYWSQKIGAFSTYIHEERPISSEDLSFENPPAIRTTVLQRSQAVIKPWMDRMEPFIVVGPEGAGKNLLLQNAFREVKNASVFTIHCSAQTSALNVIQKLNEACASFNTPKGRVLRPKTGERLILYLKDINLPKPDKYDTSQMIALLQQLVSYEGFYDDALDWVGIEKVHIVCSMNPPTTVGRANLSTRFTAIVNICYINYPDREQLQAIYGSYMVAVLNANKAKDPQFSGDANIRKLASTMVEFYEKLKAKFTVDDYRHYLYNPRDVTEWCFSLLRYDLQRNNVLDVLTYECFRLFGDRLVNEKSKQMFEQMILGIMRNNWRYEAKLAGNYYIAATGVEAGSEEQKDSGPAVQLSELGKQLEQVPTVNFQEMVTDALRSYERDIKSLNLVLFPQVLDTLAQEDRVLSRPGGSLLLVGDSGVGRRSSATLVAHMHRMAFFTPNVTLTYSHANFRADLKEQLRLTGIEGQQVMLYLEDHQVVASAVLEDINSLLSSGEVPGLYAPNEVEPLISPLKELFASMGGSGRARSVWGLFTERVKNNLHIVLSMSPTHPEFGVRTESNPAIFTKCSILWLNSWTAAGFAQVPAMRIQSVISSGAHVNADTVLDQLNFIHTSMGRKGSPLKFIALLDNYTKIYDQHFRDINGKKKTLDLGLTKLTEAAQMVDELSKQAAEKQLLVGNKQREADSALETITERMAKAGERRTETHVLQEKLSVEEVVLTKKKAEIQESLSGIQPMIDEAKAAVSGIKKDNLNEIRAFRMPPAPVKDVLTAVMAIMGQQDLSWNAMKAFLGSPSMKDDLINFDSRKITPAIHKSASGYVAATPQSFVKEVIERSSMAVAPLAAWTKANLQYSKVLAEIKPLEDGLAAADAGLKGARDRLKQCKIDLDSLDSEVQDLKKKFARTTGEAEALKLDLSKISATLSGAQELLGKLAGERDRWAKTVESLKRDINVLPSNALLGSAAVTYLGQYPEDMRMSLMREWRKRCQVKEYSFRSFMAPESEYLKWKAEGLADDNLSMENGSIIMNSSQSVFIVDPNTQATEWLKAHLAGKQLQVVMQQDPQFVTSLELAVRFGKVLVVQEVDNVIPMLYPVLRKDLFRKDARWVVQIGDKSVDYNEAFRIYMVTRNSSPDLTDAALSLVNVVNFTVTRSGLEGQLLGLALQYEKPELEKEKSKLLADEEKFKIQLSSLEELLLKELSESTGNILENKVLIESLNQTKTNSTQIAASLEHAKEVQLILDQQRDAYRPIAQSGSALFFAVSQLSSVNNMYDFALPGFIALFNQNLALPDPSRGQKGSEDVRVKNLAKTLKLLVFRYITRSLFKDDRLMFGMHLVHCLHAELFAAKEWEYFTGEIVSAEIQQSQAAFGWVPPDRLPTLSQLLVEFPTLSRECHFDNEKVWRVWITNPRCELDFPQAGGQASLSAFQRLLVIQALRPDRLQAAMQVFVCDAVGVTSVAPDSLSMARLFEESNPGIPILFITAAGADPSFEIEEYAVKTLGAKGFKQIAMGSGQMEGAMEMLKDATHNGTWVLLKNLHLVTAWLPHLEKALKASSPHKNFRLWLTTEEHPAFPPILLQQSLKVSYESPPGVKQNMLRTMEGWSEEYFKKGGVMRAQVLFSLAWFHAIVLERRTYIPQGWTKFYEFLPADMRSGADIIDGVFERLEKAGQGTNPAAVPWTTLWGLMKYAIYGGRIDNDHDVRILTTYLSTFFSEKVLAPTPQSPVGRQLSKGIVLPVSNQHADYLRVVQGLPDTDQPYLFGLANNVEGAVQQTQSAALIVALKKLAVAGALSSKFDRDAWRTGLNPLLQLWEKYAGTKGDGAVLQKPRKINRDYAKLTPSESFVVLEVDFVAKMVAAINTTLSSLNQVLHGAGLLTPLIKEEGSRLLVGRTPASWVKHWWGPDDPALWVKEVVSRRMALNGWLDLVERKQLLSVPLKLPDLFRARVLLNALRQESARVSGKPIDSLKMVASWDPLLIPQSAGIRVTVDGLLLSGCSFADNTLSGLAADAPTWSPIPPVTLAFVENSENTPYPEKLSLAVPLYFTSSREEFITEISMPCKGNRNVCVLTGVALALSTVQ